MNYTYILLIILCLTSCKQAKTKDTIVEKESEEQNISNDIKTIDLGSNFKLTDEKMKLSDAVCDVEYIKLETTDESIFESAVKIIITEKNILVSSYVFKYVYMFDRKGKFIRKLGQLGLGPREYRLGISYAGNDSMVYIQTNWLGKIMKYRTEDNSFAGAIPNANSIQNIYSLPDNKIAALARHASPIKDIFTALIINEEGDTIAYKKTDIDVERLRKSFDDPRIAIIQSWHTKEGVYMHEYHNDTIYRITSSVISPRYILNLGKYKMPEDIFYDNKKRFSEEHKYFTIRAFTESKDFLYIYFSYQDKTDSWFAQYDKIKCTVKFFHQKTHPLYGSGCFNDIDGGPMVIARNTKGDYTWYPITYEMGQEYLTPEHFAKTEVLFPKKKAELMKLIQEMKEEDNPIIALYTLK